MSLSVAELCMSELFDTRCFDCKQQSFQCSGCQKIDKGRKADMRLAKKSAAAKVAASVIPLASSAAAPDSVQSAPQTPPASSDSAQPLSTDSAVTGATAPLVVMKACTPLKPTRLADAIAAAVSAHFSSSESEGSFGLGNPKGLDAPVAGKKRKAKKNLQPFPPEADVVKSSAAAKATAPASKPTKKSKAAPPPPRSDSSVDGVDGSDSGSDDGDGDDEGEGGGAKQRGKCMPRISVKERHYVEKWIKKDRCDGSMTNGRWIRNGGAKGQSMTATSGEVRTNGAYDALALYVNKNMSYGARDRLFWTRDVAKKRWTALYKSYKDATLLSAKGNSTAGASQEQIETGKSSVLAAQKKKCPSFCTFHLLFQNHPTVKPINPKEVGSVGTFKVDDTPPQFKDSELDDDETKSKQSEKPAAAAGGGAVGGGDPKPAAGGGEPKPVSGKPPAPPPFHMAPSKKSPKMDLGEAYLKSQQLRIESMSSANSAKLRMDLICALSSQNKTAAEIEAFLQLMYPL